MALLTEADRLDIVSRLKAGEQPSTIAKRYNITNSNVRYYGRKARVEARRRPRYRKVSDAIFYIVAGGTLKDFERENDYGRNTTYDLLKNAGFRLDQAALFPDLTSEQREQYAALVDGSPRVFHADALAIVLGVDEAIPDVEDEDDVPPAPVPVEKGTRWAPDEIAELRKLVRFAFTYAEIAKRLGRTAKACKQAAVRNGVTCPETASERIRSANKGKTVSAATRAKIGRQSRKNMKRDWHRNSIATISNDPDVRARQMRKQKIGWRGYDVPPEREEEYRLYKRKKFTIAEIGELMGLTPGTTCHISESPKRR